MNENDRQLLETTDREARPETPETVSFWRGNIKIARRIVIAVLGATVLLIGIALIVLPGPAFIVIPIGLAILATEFAWARRWLKKIKQVTSNLVSRKSKS